MSAQTEPATSDFEWFQIEHWAAEFSELAANDALAEAVAQARNGR